MKNHPQFVTGSTLRLVGWKSEIDRILFALSNCGFVWKTNGKYYRQRGDSTKYAYYLEHFSFEINTLIVQEIYGQNPPTHSLCTHHTHVK